MADKTEKEYGCVHCDARYKHKTTDCPKCKQKGGIVPLLPGEDSKTALARISRGPLDGVEISTDQFGDTFAQFSQEKIIQAWPTRSRPFRRFLLNRLRENAASLSENAITTTLLDAEATAATAPSKERLLRATKTKDAFLIDLGGPEWIAQKISAQGVSSIPAAEHFRRFETTLPLVIDASGKREDFDSFVNLLGATLETRILLETYLLTAWLAGFPHVVLVVYGPNGSAKSSRMSAIKTLLDPETVGLSSLPKSEAELAQHLSHHYIAYYDNLSGLSQAQSDALCRACTGESFTKRQLFTDEGDVVFQYQRLVGLNGISVPATAPDLLDRAILLSLKRIPAPARITDADFKEKVGLLVPKARGFIMAALPGILQRLDSIPRRNLPRMADFAVYGETAAQELGYPAGAFLEAYAANQTERTAAALDNSLVADVIRAFLDETQHFEGTPKALYAALDGFTQAKGTNLKGTEWPKAANALMRELAKLEAALADSGYWLRTTRNSKERKVELGKGEIPSSNNIVTNIVTQISLVNDGCDDNDDICGYSTNTQKKGTIGEASTNIVTTVISSFPEVKTNDDIDDDISRPEKTVTAATRIVRFLDDVPEFVSSDMTTLGPFTKGQEATLSTADAELLKSRNLAEVA